MHRPVHSAWRDQPAQCRRSPLLPAAGLLALAAAAAGPAHAAPTGVSFSSNSGVFLMSAVPEPQTAAMLLAGLLVLGRLARRRCA